MDENVQVLRIGGRSKCKELDQYNLKELRNKIIEDTRPKHYPDPKQQPYTASKFLIYHYQEKEARKNLPRLLETIQRLHKRKGFKADDEEVKRAVDDYEAAIKKIQILRAE